LYIEQTWGNSILELELMISFGIGIDYLKKMELELINLELKFATKNLIHKLIYYLIFSFRNISSLRILL